MKKIINISVAIITIIQSILLFLYFTEKLSNYPSNIVDIIWISFNSLGVLLGILFFRLNKEIKVPTNTISIIALLGIIGFPFMLLKYWIVILLLIIFAIGLHFQMYRNSKSTIVPVVSAIMGIYSMLLLLLTIGITSM